MNLRATFLICVTILVGVGIFTTYYTQYNRFSVYPQQKAVFVFDRKNFSLNHCNEKGCQLVVPQIPMHDPRFIAGGMPTQQAIIDEGCRGAWPQPYAAATQPPYVVYENAWGGSHSPYPTQKIVCPSYENSYANNSHENEHNTAHEEAAPHPQENVSHEVYNKQQPKHEGGVTSYSRMSDNGNHVGQRAHY